MAIKIQKWSKANYIYYSVLANTKLKYLIPYERMFFAFLSLYEWLRERDNPLWSLLVFGSDINVAKNGKWN